MARGMMCFKLHQAMPIETWSLKEKIQHQSSKTSKTSPIQPPGAFGISLKGPTPAKLSVMLPDV
jgi:hypothetical protein